ncbi:type II secretion system protein [bacterium]|nr:type II secretion system protein [bacterium]
MKKGFTIVEVAILFVIFLIVAFLVAPLSIDDTLQARFTSKWRNVQEDFVNILYAVNSQQEDESISFDKAFVSAIDAETKQSVKPYKISYMDGTYPSKTYRFDDYKLTYSNAVISFKMFEEPQENSLGMLMYDVNGCKGPNVWGKDVFGLELFNDHFEPYGHNESVAEQKRDCSKNGTGLFCSNYYLIGGNFD